MKHQQKDLSRTVDPECQIFQRYHAGTVSKHSSQDPQNIIQKSDPHTQQKGMQQKNIFIHQRNSLPRKDSCFSPDAAVSEYTRLSIRPSISTSPLSNVRRFTWSSLPRIISIPCSVSSRISRRSKERTSFTPFTVHVRLLVMVTLCIRPVAFKSSILSIASHPPLLPEPDLQCIVWENVEIYT